MEQNRNIDAPESAAERAEIPDHRSPDRAGLPADTAAPPADPPDLVEPLIADTIAETFPPGSRKPRHDGWTPEAVGGYLRELAAHEIVEHAARAVGRSAASAYAFRNRPQGRAFARMWDAVLIHRARARLAAENQACATLGCVSHRYGPDGELIGSYRYRDNRLAMAMLSRLDRLAEREAPNEDHLRALSEDLDGFIACAEAGGDLDAFVAERRPALPEPASDPAEAPQADWELVMLARAEGCEHLLARDPLELDVVDLDPGRMAEWTGAQWVRAFCSGFMTWLNIRADDPGWSPGPGEPFRYLFMRDAAAAANAAYGPPCDEAEQAEADKVDTSDLDPARIEDWDDEQLARAWRGGLLGSLDIEFWEKLADRGPSEHRDD